MRINLRIFLFIALLVLFSKHNIASAQDNPTNQIEEIQTENSQAENNKPDNGAISGEAKDKGYRQDYQNACTNPKDREEADLCQQWRSANAASQTVKLARWQIVTSIAEAFLLIVTLCLSGWAALAASSAAKTAKREIEELERPHLLALPSDLTLVEETGEIDINKPITYHFKNFGRSPGFMIAVKTRIAYRKKKDGIPPPMKWDRFSASIFSFGSIVECGDVSEDFTETPSDYVTHIDVQDVGPNGDWYLQGFAVYQDTMNGIYIIGYCVTWHDGKWFIVNPDEISQYKDYNYSIKRKRPPFLHRKRFDLARSLRAVADKLSPPAEQ